VQAGAPDGQPLLQNQTAAAYSKDRILVKLHEHIDASALYFIQDAQVTIKRRTAPAPSARRATTASGWRVSIGTSS